MSIGELYVNQKANSVENPLNELMLKSKFSQYISLKKMSDEMKFLQAKIHFVQLLKQKIGSVPSTPNITA